MATQLINVIVNSKGMVTVQKQLSHLGSTAQSTSNYLNSLRTVLAAALAFSGIGAIVRTADTFTVLQNRLRQVTDEATMVGDSWNRLIDIANNSYSTIDGTVNLYFRVAQAYKAWGESADEAFKFTELFQKSAILSGSSMQTTAQAVYQFSQALNKGKLDGDEFRSVLEGLPYVATLIQNSLGVTRAELYKLSKDGKISVDRITQAFEDAAAIIEGDWANITPTIGMALTVLSNNWTDFVGRIQTSTGVFSGIAYVILVIANNFDLLAIALAPVLASMMFLGGKLAVGLVVLGFQEMQAVLGPLIAKIWALNFAMLANPYVLAAVAIAAVVAAIIYFRNELGLTNEVLNTVWTVAVTVFTSIVSYIWSILTAIGQVIANFTDWGAIFTAIGNTAIAVKNAVVSSFLAIMKAMVDLVKYLAKGVQPIFEAIVELVMEIAAVIMEIVEINVNAWGPSVMVVWEAMKTLWEYTKPALRDFIQLVADIFEGWKRMASWFQSNFMPVLKDIFEGWVGMIKGVINFVKNLIGLLKQALQLMKGLGGGGGGAAPKGAHYGMQGYAGEFAGGGRFNVGGTGAGRDTTPVAFRAERGERVTVETKKQQRANDNSAPVANVNVPVNITNVLDPSMVPAGIETAAGVRSLINVMRGNREEFQQILGVI